MNRINNILNVKKLHKIYGNGRSVNVAVLDSGMYPHPDLIKNLVFFKDIVENKVKPYDDSSHGTHICGIIAAYGPYPGIAPGAGLIPIKVLDKSGTGYSYNIIEGIDWIKQNYERYNIRIVNISIGTKSISCDDESSLLVKAVDELWDMGLVVVTSAGNNGPGYNTITVPGISRKVITVGSNDPMPHRDSGGKIQTSYSGKGPTFCNVVKPDILAPARNIISCANIGREYAAKSGTSMSTPIVSGAAALTLCANPSLSNEEFKRILCNSSSDIGLDRYTQGCGFINLTKLLFLAVNPV